MADEVPGECPSCGFCYEDEDTFEGGEPLDLDPWDDCESF